MSQVPVHRTDCVNGVVLSRLVFGANVLGWTVDRDTSFALLDRLLDAGVTTIDTADMYATWAPGHVGGESETVLGEWLHTRGVRQHVQLITKVGMAAPANPAPGQGLSAAYIERAVEASLTRLRTDVIDIYMSHQFDASVPQQETLTAYERLIQAGKVRAVGASNYTAPQLREALDVARAHGLPRYRVLEPRYNLIDRAGFDGPLRDLAMAEQIAVIPYFSLASGFLTGKYRSEADLARSPRAAWVKPYLNPRGLRVLAALDAVADARRVQPSEVALAWLMARPGVTAPIASATSVAQLDSLVRATQLSLAPEDIRALDAASAPDAPQPNPAHA